MIQSISVNGEVHQIDYTTLANKPTIPVIPSVTSADQGKVLAVNSEGEWYAANVPSELPSVSSSASGKSLIVDGYGNWALSSSSYSEQITNLQRDFNNYIMVTSSQLLPYGESSADEGKILVCNGHSWDFSDFTMQALQGQISMLATQLSQLQERVSRLASSLSDTEAYAANETLTLSGAGVSVSGEKLSIDDTAANVTGEKLSIA